jgi:hypothetical protein
MPLRGTGLTKNEGQLRGRGLWEDHCPVFRHRPGKPMDRNSLSPADFQILLNTAGLMEATLQLPWADRAIKRLRQ